VVFVLSWFRDSVFSSAQRPAVSYNACLFAKGETMPKMKTHKASRKRFRVSANGKLKRSQAGKKHLNSPKTAKRKRHLRAKPVETGRLPTKYIRQMGEA
jgi:large subunit ribosomal protein L35